jgi:hypothetical protein
MALLMFDYDATPGSVAFVNSPDFLIWMFLISVVTALCALLPFPLFKALKELKPDFRGRWIEIVAATLLIVILFWIPFLLADVFRYLNLTDAFFDDFPLAHHKLKIRVVSLLAFVTTAIPASAGIVVINSVLVSTTPGRDSSDLTLSKYKTYNRLLNLFLAALGAMVGLLILATGALRNALLTWDIEPSEYPAGLVLAWGLYNTFILALLYVPASQVLLTKGRELCNSRCPVPLSDTQNLESALSARKALEEELQLNISPQDRLKTGMVIAAPLLSGILSSLVG